MVAKIVGVGLVFWGAVLAFALIVPVLGSLFAAAVLAVTGLLAAGLLYVGLRWLRGEHAGKGAGRAMYTRWHSDWDRSSIERRCWTFLASFYLPLRSLLFARCAMSVELVPAGDL